MDIFPKLDFISSTFMKAEGVGEHLLVLQCDSGDENATMIASARYNIAEQHHDAVRRSKDGVECRKHVILIVHLPRKRGGCFTGFEVCLTSFYKCMFHIYVSLISFLGRTLAVLPHR